MRYPRAREHNGGLSSSLAGERARSFKKKSREERVMLDLNLEYQYDIALQVMNEVHQSNLEKIQFRNNVLAQVEDHVEAINATPIGDLFPYDEPVAQNLHKTLRLILVTLL